LGERILRQRSFQLTFQREEDFVLVVF